MTYANLLFRPDLGYKAYRLRCRFVICAFPTQGQVETAKHEAGYRFIEDMDKQGYEYIDSHGVQMSGPFAHTPIIGLPSYMDRQRIKAREAVGAVAQGARLLTKPESFVSSVPALGETDSWEFELAAVFKRKTIVFEYNEATPNDN